MYLHDYINIKIYECLHEKDIAKKYSNKIKKFIIKRKLHNNTIEDCVYVFTFYINLERRIVNTLIKSAINPEQNIIEFLNMFIDG